MNQSLPRASWTPRLAIIVISLFSMVLCVGVFIPAFVDDILYIVTNNRAGYDGWQSINVFPQCRTDFAMAIPLTLLPGKAWLWAVHLLISDFYSLRLTTLFVFVSWIAYTAWFLKRCLLPAQPWPIILAGVLGVVGLGTLPFALLLGRPETSMIFAVTFFTSMPFVIDTYPRPARWIVALSALVFFLIASLFLSLHGKAVFFIPALMVSAFHFHRWHKIAGLLLSAIIAITCWQAVSSWHQGIACPDSSIARATMDQAVTLPSLFLENNVLFWRELIYNLTVLNAYIWEITLPRGGWWLPDFMHSAAIGALPRGMLFVLAALHTVLWAVTTLFLIIIGLRLLFFIAAGLYSVVCGAVTRHSRIRFDLLLPFCLLAACLAQCATQSEKVFYHVSLIWVTLVLSGMTLAGYLLKYTDYWNTHARDLGQSYRILLMVATLSQCALLFTYVPATLLMLREPAPNGIIQFMAGGKAHWKGTLIAEQNFDETRKHIVNAARLCRIPADRSGRHLVVDEFTYFALKTTYQPFLSLYLFKEFDDPQKLFAFLHRRQSSGLVTLCASLPEKIRPFAKESGGVCCIPREQINSGL